MTTDTKTLLLQEAETLLRTRGYAAFSYADLSERVGIRKASIHHHFPTKEDLGVAVIDTYLERFKEDLDELATKPVNAAAKLAGYGDFFASSLCDRMMPLCGALAADSSELPPSMQKRVSKFFQLHLDWLQGAIAEGIREKELKAEPSAARTAVLLLSTLQGASIVAWALTDPSLIKRAYGQVLETIIR
ncbi:MAG: TetR/AcrR family transcriptional regulator [Proteobacteria bacterium]|nr:TetR/AcrR family transcriptional regulator [Pseudomonadota bacterium]